MSDDAGAVGGDVGGGDVGGDSGGGEPSQAGLPASGRVVGQEPIEDDTPEKREARAKEKPPVQKLKVKRGGKEEEYEPEELAKRFSDDYEHEFQGPGGKPVKLKWDDIGRAVQLSHGAQARIARAAEMEKRLRESIEGGRKDPVAFLEAELGIEDADQWALQRAAEAYQRRNELTELMTPDTAEKFQKNPRALRYNPDEYHKRIRDDLKAKTERREANERRRAEETARAEETRRRESAGRASLSAAFKAAGVPFNSENEEIAKKIFATYAQAGTRLPHDQIAELTKREYHKNLRAQLSALPPEALSSLLGDDLTKRLREYEVERLKGKKKEERAAQTETVQHQTNGKGSEPKRYTEGEIKRMERTGRYS